MKIHKIYLKNYKSIKESTIDFKDLNIFIGANGSGKSNLISFFKLLNNIVNQNLQIYIKSTGRAESYLYFGPKNSTFIEGELLFLNDSKNLSNRYRFNLIPTQDGGFIFDSEFNDYNKYGTIKEPIWDEGIISPRGAHESQLPHNRNYRDEYLDEFLRKIKIFHFHDTSSTAPVKRFCNINDYNSLREDGGNLAAFLYHLQHNSLSHYNIIEKIIRSVAPFFNRFDLRPTSENNGEINLKWLENGSENYFDANHLSDGTLRFICLTTLLMQQNPPDTIIIDEPELGLHPFAIDKLTGMIKSSSLKSQIIISTQSVELISSFNPEDIIIAEHKDNQSTFKRLDPKEIEEWLQNYTLGELWNKNVLGGTP
jgi:predicted ATPase